MSHEMNLIPHAYRARLRRGRTRRSVAIALCVSGLAIGLIGWSLHVAVMQRRADLNDLKSFVAEMRSVAADAEALQARITDIDLKLQTQQELQHPVEVSAMLATLCSLMPSSATLDSMELRTSLRAIEGSDADQGRSSLPIKDEESTREIMICEVTGVAKSDLDVADFVGRLTDHPLFQQVALDYSRPVVVRETAGRTFRISCQMDLERTYIIEAPAEVAEANAEESVEAMAEVTDEG
ncbi:MAG: PilN domain-containing protein [Phycisphaerales bacterium JB038]